MNVKQYAAPDGALLLLWMRLQRCRAAGAQVEVMGKFFHLIRVMVPLTFVSICLFGYVLNSHCDLFRQFQATLLSLQWMLPVCIAVWCGSFIFLTFSLNDLPLIGLLLVAIATYFFAARPATDAITLLAGVTLGKGVQFLLNAEGRRQRAEGQKVEVGSQKSEVRIFLIGLVALLAFASWWHLDMTDNYYHGPRWMGLWDNPNLYGMLMGAGIVLTAGLLVDGRWKMEDGETSSESRKQKAQIIFLWIAAGMMAVGLIFSYSRGAWVGTAVGLLYLAKTHGKLKWRYVILGAGVLALASGMLWGRTPDSAPWYVKRADLGRPSAQHRVAAWKAGFEIMRDHPLGVGWNQAVGVYDKNYSPPEGGAAALTMNSYLMLGTELGIPALVCFVAYMGLVLKGDRSWKFAVRKKFPHLTLTLSPSAAGSGEGIRTACRAGALVLVVAFWFDGGLFTLATASVFWILLELSQMRSAECGMGNQKNLP